MVCLSKAILDTVAALTSLTKNEAISESNLRSLKGFVCSMCNSKLKTVTDVRWDMLKRNPSMNMERLPPTSAAVYQHILRAQYQCLVWEKAMTAVPGFLEASVGYLPSSRMPTDPRRCASGSLRAKAQ